jgi:hypothetical protein
MFPGEFFGLYGSLFSKRDRPRREPMPKPYVGPKAPPPPPSRQQLRAAARAKKKQQGRGV